MFVLQIPSAFIVTAAYEMASISNFGSLHFLPLLVTILAVVCIFYSLFQPWVYSFVLFPNSFISIFIFINLFLLGYFALLCCSCILNGMFGSFNYIFTDISI